MSDSSKEASDILVQHWQKGTTLKELPASIRPAESVSGYAIQRHVQSLTILLSDISQIGYVHHFYKPLAGWKIAATSSAGQKHINVARPLAGRILEERVARWSPSSPLPTVSLGPNRMQVAELEFVFLMGAALPPRGDGNPHGIRDVMDAVAALHLGSEIPDSRYEDFTAVGEAQLIADNACADRFVLGPEVTQDWRGGDLAAHAVKGWAVDGAGKEGETHYGSGAEVLSDPRVALTWLVNELNEHGMTLEKGEFVTTGTCIIPIPVKPGDTVTGDYGDFGTLKLKFVE